MTEPSAFIPSTPQNQTTLICTQDFPWLLGRQPLSPASSPVLAERPGPVTRGGDGGKQEVCHGLSSTLDESYACVPR